MMKIKILFICLIFCHSMSAIAATLCIAPIGSNHLQYGQDSTFTVVIEGKKYPVSYSKAIRVAPLKINKNIKVIILNESGKAQQSFLIKMAKNDQNCIVKNDLYPTWMLREMNKSCRC